MLIDRDVLVRRGAAWDLVGAEQDIPVPENVQALIAARLDTLSPERKALLHDAAVIGKVFWAGALAEMGGQDPATVRQRLHELGRKELLRPARRPSIEGETEYAFWHLLIRDVAYGQIPRAARAAKHRAVAEWIERIAGERVADSAELLAYHYEQAIELGSAAGADVTDLGVQAVRFLMLGAERAHRLDLAKAQSLVERALLLTRPGDPDRFRVLLLGGQMRVSEFSGEMSDDLLERAVEEARSTGNALGEAEALAWLSRMAWGRGETSRQLELLGQAAQILEGKPPGREAAVVMARLAAAHGLAGRSAETLARSEDALPLVREFSSEHDLAVVLQWRGQARIDLGDVAGGFEDLREGLRIALESSPASFAVAAHINLGDSVWFVEGPVKGQALYEVGAELADRRAAGGAGDWARMESMWTRYDLGAWDEMLEVGDRLVGSNVHGATSQLGVLVEIYRRAVMLQRDVSDPEAIVETVLLPRAREIGDGQVVVPVFGVASLGRLAAGDVAGALALVEEIDELLRHFVGFRSWLLDWAARVCLAGGAVDLLRSLIEQAVEHMTRDANSVASARAALAELEGHHSSALERYDEAATRWGAFPSVLEHGHALAGAGRCQLALGRAADAMESLRGARERYASLGAAPLVSEMDALLERATAKTS